MMVTVAATLRPGPTSDSYCSYHWQPPFPALSSRIGSVARRPSRPRRDGRPGSSARRGAGGLDLQFHPSHSMSSWLEFALEGASKIDAHVSIRSD
jgi:hypothetical protein